MYLEKIKSLKESIITDSIKIKFSSILSLIKSYSETTDDDKEYEFKVITNNIFNYFYELSGSIFDVFVCEGGSEEYSYKSFKLFYMNIFYSFLQDFFIKNTEIKEFFKNIPEKEYYKVYSICEDSLFNFISHYYFTCNEEYKKRIEHILNNIIQFDCDTKEKEKRYKRILFLHYKESLCNELLSYMDKIKNKMKTIQKEITSIKLIVKILKTYYYDFNKEYGMKMMLENDTPIPTYLYPQYSTTVDLDKSSITRETLWNNVKFFKDEIKNKNKEYSELEKIYHVQGAKYSHAFELTQEKFERGE